MAPHSEAGELRLGIKMASQALYTATNHVYTLAVF